MYNFLPTVKRLLFNGPAFRVFFDTQHEKILDASQVEAGRVKIFFDDIRDAGIPNGNLPVDALDDWELFLGLPMNTALTTTERNERIKGKYAGQGGQGPDYIQDTIQAAGFPVYVLENIPADNPSVRAYTARAGGVTSGQTTSGAYTNRVDPRSVTGFLIAGPAIFESEKIYSASAGNTTAGQRTSGEYFGTITKEFEYTIPGIPARYIFVWFLTGPTGLNDFVDIPLDRKQDFINQVLQIKPAHTWCLAQVNFV